MNKKLILIIASIVALFSIASVSAGFFDFLHWDDDSDNINVVEDGQYCTVNQVSAYIKEFHKLPSNYITKKEAQSLGWHGGPLKKYAPGKSIGGDTFTNRQHILPDSDYKYIECDINANGTFRGAERIVYNTGNYKVYYTDDHYNTFTEV
ncbi:MULTISPECIES: ribonuclease domain-containing protein [Methanobrevibacter]|uniref:Ribonuclease n=1 Tax=Methanobrevibacter gottschalkii DSM 11977 TaxID=1122229 RepID=A0A3N5B6G5_9EURY|nr:MULTISPECIES: ribonuclease domain-containing protein [Methanobrevibacter]OEC99897.1 ribonuclease [Methanobrevibacter sp. A27]RPF52887.1 ribonuclease [Methanobrevibacter gottschalkii DSM 11977]